MKFLVRSVVAAIALWLCSVLLPGISAPPAQDNTQLALYLLATGAIFTLVATIIRPILVVLSLPFYIITLGLFSLVINAVVLLLSSAIANHFGWGLSVDNFFWVILGGLLIAIVVMILDIFLPSKYRR